MATGQSCAGAISSLDSALLNGGNGAVSFGVTDGSVFYAFAKDPSTVFSPGTVCTLTASFEIGRASCRERSVALGGRSIVEKKRTGGRGTRPAGTVEGASGEAGA